MEAAISRRKNAGLSVLGGIGLVLGFGVGVGVWSQFQDLAGATERLSLIGFFVLMPAIGFIVRGALTAVTGRGWHDTPAIVRLFYIAVFVPVVVISTGLGLIFLIQAVSSA